MSVGENGDLTFEPVNMGQALNVAADIVAAYIGCQEPLAGLEPKKASQIAVTVFLHSLLMRAKHKEEMANILDLISAELREAAKAEPPTDNPARPTSSDS